MIKIKKIITAIGINSLNLKLKKYSKLEVIGNDIPYQDGVLDILKGNSEVDTLLLNEDLLGEYDVKTFIFKIFEINKNIEIIFFMEMENQSLRRFLEKNNISKIYLIDDFDLEEVVNDILEKKDTQNVNLEIEELKRIIKDQNTKKFSRKTKVIAVSGNYGSGKSVITSLLGKSGKKSGLKTIILDFDILNNSINTIFRVKKYKDVEGEALECFITHISSNLDVFCGIDTIFTEENKISYEKVEKLFSDLKDIYDLILVDTSSETNLKYMKIVLENVDKMIFLLEPNLLEIKKTEKLLEIYLEDWEINPKKIDILLNKVNCNSVDIDIIKEIFGKFKIVGKVNYSSKFTEIANNIKESELGLNKYVKLLEKIG